MYRIIEGDNLNDFFSTDEIDMFFAQIRNQLNENIQHDEDQNKMMFGCFCLKDFNLTDGDIKNVYLEYSGKPKFGDDHVYIDVSIAECIIFEGMPDIILDKWNEQKKIKESYEI
jgi:hypothetical protein